MQDFLKIRQTIAEIARVNFLQNLIGIRRSGFDNMEVLIFCTFCLKTPAPAPKIWGFGDMAPKWDAISTKPSIVTFLAERRRTMRRSSKSAHWCDLWACPTNQKRKTTKETRQWQTRCSPFAETIHVIGSKCRLAWWVVPWR